MGTEEHEHSANAGCGAGTMVLTIVTFSSTLAVTQRERNMIATRAAKFTMAASLALYTFVVAFDNVTDYGSNFEFVKHVLSMDTTFPGNKLMYRAVSEPLLWHLSYGAIILGEALTSLFFALGAIQLFRTLYRPAAEFHRAKHYIVIAATLAFVVWFTGFMIVGGEWFAMWQSKIWNGRESAFRVYMTALAVLVFVNQRDEELGGEAAHGVETVSARTPRVERPVPVGE